jgi:large subunit ribosomal protein L4
MAKLAIYNKEGKESGSLEMPEIFGARVNTYVMHQAVEKYHTSQRQGNASTKDRAQVSGGGKKPWRQKGTGRARHGSSRSPLWRHGGTTFGPLPKVYRYEIPRRITQSALLQSLNAKFQGKKLVCLNEIKGEFKKTKEFAAILHALKLEGSVLFVVESNDEAVKGAAKNIAGLGVKDINELNARDILSHRSLLITKGALEKILKRTRS